MLYQNTRVLAVPLFIIFLMILEKCNYLETLKPGLLFTKLSELNRPIYGTGLKFLAHKTEIYPTMKLFILKYSINLTFFLAYFVIKCLWTKKKCEGNATCGRLHMFDNAKHILQCQETHKHTLSHLHCKGFP